MSEHHLPESGPAAPPRSNGELVFAAPWESRIFGLTLALLDAGHFQWPEFQGRLIEAIARHEATLGDDGYQYYACWLDAFRALATDKGWLDEKALMDLEAGLAARPPGHDH
jgi:nitrile hydratase accessory protein